jgi:hypothetical protein
MKILMENKTKMKKNITSLNMKWDYAIKIGPFGFG